MSPLQVPEDTSCALCGGDAFAWGDCPALTPTPAAPHPGHRTAHEGTVLNRRHKKQAKAESYKRLSDRRESIWSES
jgi:hypothetical protein